MNTLSTHCCIIECRQSRWKERGSKPSTSQGKNFLFKLKTLKMWILFWALKRNYCLHILIVKCTIQDQFQTKYNMNCLNGVTKPHRVYQCYNDHSYNEFKGKDDFFLVPNSLLHKSSECNVSLEFLKQSQTLSVCDFDSIYVNLKRSSVMKMVKNWKYR